jgi:hypothetical protein
MFPFSFSKNEVETLCLSNTIERLASANRMEMIGVIGFELIRFHVHGET